MDINNLFFELIRVAIGNQVCLSRTPKLKEWQELYAMAKKQSLVGICFAGVQKLQAQRQAPNSWGNEQGEVLYLQWMGMAAKIQQRNEVVNRQCVELQVRLKADGFNCCILKGQGVAQLYDKQLRNLRQSGDIDVWIPEKPDIITDYIKRVFGAKSCHATSMHIDMPLFKDTDVEVHFVPSMCRNPYADKRMQKWIKAETSRQMNNRLSLSNEELLNVPTTDFNIIFLISHAFRHMMGEGIGLRQVMDIYFALRTSKFFDNKRDDVIEKLRLFGLLHFTEGLMWIMQRMFRLEDSKLLTSINEIHGKYIYDEVLIAGNFGLNDERLRSKDYKGRSRLQLKRNLKQIKYYPAEAIGTFYWRFRNLVGISH